MPKIQFTVGISASGKSTYAENLRLKEDFQPIERDTVRAIIQKNGLERAQAMSISEYRGEHISRKGPDWGTWKWKNEKFVTEIQRGLIEKAYRDGVNVVISDTNLNFHRLKSFKGWAEKIGFEVMDDKVFDISVEEAWERDRKRLNGVGHSVIFKQWLEFNLTKNLLSKNAWDCIRPLNAPKVTIFDIDGTLAEATSRDIYDWDRVIEDEPIEAIVTIAKALIAAGEPLIIVSGRDAVCRKQTEKWLKKHGISYLAIFMRPKGDKRKDTIVKQEILTRDILPFYDVKMAFDDRPSVVRMWQSWGIPTCALGHQHWEF